MVTEKKSSSLYFTLGYIFLAFKLLLSKCENATSANDAVLEPIEEVMMNKLQSYNNAIIGDVSDLGHIWIQYLETR